MEILHEAVKFLDDLVIATTLILTTCIIHGFGMDRMMGTIIKPHHLIRDGKRRRFYKLVMAVGSILGVFLLVTTHIWTWAVAYRLLEIPEFKTLEDAVYFSTVTFTTLGYGDIVLHDKWRVLSGIEAANGIILLGWSTAFLFEIIFILYPRRVNQ